MLSKKIKNKFGFLGLKYVYLRSNFEQKYFDNAGVAQLVEHHLAKVRVAGSSPVSRSFY